MQPYVTPAPGRCPGTSNIVHREDYRLDITLTEFRHKEYHLLISKWIPEHGWTSNSLFLTEDELERVKQSINAVK